MPSPADQLPALLDGVVDVIPHEELERRLEAAFREGRPLRVKLGVDPSRPDLHIGHAVVLQKLRQFQDFGHTAVLIVGDFTGRVGDPSGQSETRPFLSEEEIEANARTYFEQAGIVLDLDRAEVHRNSEWLARMDMAEVLRLTAATTVARMLERDDFATRYAEGRAISVVEFLYPLMQAMDSVAIRADVELGGTDQTFNLLVGRDIQRAHGQEPQVVVTLPLLEGTDGVRKMSKSLDNCIGLTDPPEEMFGRLMRIPDGLIPKYLHLAAGLPAEDAERSAAGLADGRLHPNAEKRRMARAVVDRYRGGGAGVAAESAFDRVHREHRLPEDIPVAVVEPGERYLPRVLVEIGLARSTSEARRLIEQGGVRIDGLPVADLEVDLGTSGAGRIVQVGNRQFRRVVPGPGAGGGSAGGGRTGV